MVSTLSSGRVTSISMYLSGAILVSHLPQRSAIYFLMGCFIVTEVILGGMVAVPGAFLCIARRLDFASSKQSTATQLRHTIFEVLTCIILPIVYMALRECSIHFKVSVTFQLPDHFDVGLSSQIHLCRTTGSSSSRTLVAVLLFSIRCSPYCLLGFPLSCCH